MATTTENEEYETFIKATMQQLTSGLKLDHTAKKQKVAEFLEKHVIEKDASAAERVGHRPQAEASGERRGVIVGAHSHAQLARRRPDNNRGRRCRGGGSRARADRQRFRSGHKDSTTRRRQGAPSAPSSASVSTDRAPKADSHRRGLPL